jgi:hypothetical protein
MSARSVDLICASYLAIGHVLRVASHPPRNGGAEVTERIVSTAGDGVVVALTGTALGMRAGLIANPVGIDPDGLAPLRHLARRLDGALKRLATKAPDAERLRVHVSGCSRHATATSVCTASPHERTTSRQRDSRSSPGAGWAAIRPLEELAAGRVTVVAVTSASQVENLFTVAADAGSAALLPDWLNRLTVTAAMPHLGPRAGGPWGEGRHPARAAQDSPVRPRHPGAHYGADGRVPVDRATTAVGPCESSSGSQPKLHAALLIRGRGKPRPYPIIGPASSQHR